MAKRYRKLVFETFHTQIEVYGQRQQAWPDVYADWKAAGRRFEQQERLIDWLEAAIRGVRARQERSDPEKPHFEDAGAVKPEGDVPKGTAPRRRPAAARVCRSLWQRL